MELVKIREGGTEVFVWKGERISSDLPVFYNPEMEFNRNISVASIAVFAEEFDKELRICDALSASGIAGIRYGREIKNLSEIWLNDKNPRAIELIIKNLSLQGLKLTKINGKWESLSKPKFIVTKKDACRLLSENVFSVIDLDPYGSPVPFIDSVARSIYWNGFVCITATDTAPLCGTYPLACFRKYGVKSFRCHFSKELGLRILVSTIIREFAKHEKAFLPLFGFYHKHFFRVHGRASPRESEITKLLKNFGFVSFCEKCGMWFVGEEPQPRCKCGEKMKITGEIYLGEIWNKRFILDVIDELKRRGFKKEQKLAEIILRESEITNPFFYDLHFISSTLNKSPVKIEHVINSLRQLGYKACRTHFASTGIRTDANYDEVVKAIKSKTS